MARANCFFFHFFFPATFLCSHFLKAVKKVLVAMRKKNVERAKQQQPVIYDGQQTAAA